MQYNIIFPSSFFLLLLFHLVAAISSTLLLICFFYYHDNKVSPSSLKVALVLTQCLWLDRVKCVEFACPFHFELLGVMPLPTCRYKLVYQHLAIMQVSRSLGWKLLTFCVCLINYLCLSLELNFANTNLLFILQWDVHESCEIVHIVIYF